jgi:hypothetical protein
MKHWPKDEKLRFKHEQHHGLTNRNMRKLKLIIMPRLMLKLRPRLPRYRLPRHR